MKEAMELLNEAYRALNTAHRFKYDDTDSYELAAKISEYLKSMPLARPFTDKMLSDILATAFEGGVGYWCCIEDYRITHSLCTSDPKYCWVPLYQGNSIQLCDAEDDDEKWELTRDDIELALTKIALERPQTYKRLLNEEYDADDADVFLQIAAIGEVTYG